MLASRSSLTQRHWVGLRSTWSKSRAFAVILDFVARASKVEEAAEEEFLGWGGEKRRSSRSLLLFLSQSVDFGSSRGWEHRPVS